MMFFQSINRISFIQTHSNSYNQNSIDIKFIIILLFKGKFSIHFIKFL
eukprot:UN20989